MLKVKDINKIQAVKIFLLFIINCPLIITLSSCENIFSPKLDNNTPTSILTDQKTIEGLFQNFKFAYTFKDTTVYGNLLAEDFIFTYRDYEFGFDVTWDRATEMRTTNGLFQTAQKLEVVWNNIIFQGGDSLNQNVKRSFNLTITFNPSDITRLNGFVDMNFRRNSVNDIWKILIWRDESF
ncbi:MAG: hypothetical protein M3R36_06285 [Bacteroidota bacterium]|nr:hypothetical protein [Bacteroidota bacterium]